LIPRFVRRLHFFTVFFLAISLDARTFLLADDPPPKSLQELSAILSEWEEAKNEHLKLYLSAKNRDDQEKVRTAQVPDPAPFAERCLKLAERYPGTQAELSALWCAVCHAPDVNAGLKAYEQLAKGRVASANLSDLAVALDGSDEAADPKKALGLAPLVLDRVKRNPDHARAAWLLNWVCSNSLQDGDQDPSQLFREAADLILTRYAGSPDITNFCECLGMGRGSPTWALNYEKHLLRILKENRNRRVRGGASFALASVVHFTGGEARQDEADRLYERFLNDFDGSDPVNGVEKHLRRAAYAAREELRWRAVGKTVPEIEGKDLEGRPLKLSDHRGKVVLLSFWGTWCFPCMKLVPHERALIERLRDKPFVLLGVNADLDEEAVQGALVKHQITWRSFRNKSGNEPSISSAWDVIGFPTLYLIDHKGIIRKRWVGAPTPAELDRAVDEQVEKAASKSK
jgi:thiol-disulfide isomerase/thioredoxin